MSARPAEQLTRPGRWLVLPLLAFGFVSVAVGLLARERTISPNAYPGGYFRLFSATPST
jgi:hypothetical protein